jgi:hypothetical protein
MSGHTTPSRGETYQMEMSRWTTGRNVLMLAALISIIGCVAGYFTDEQRLFRSYLVAFTFVAAIGLGAFFFVMVQYLSGSAWSVTVRRIMENIMITLPVCAILFIPVALGLKHIYSWTDVHMMEASPSLKGKVGYLSPPFFILRTYIYFALWSIWAFGIYRNSTRQDRERSIKQMHNNSRWSAPGLFLTVVVGTLAAWDWVMSVQPGWYSTIFGLYYLAGGALAFMAVVTLICMGFRKAGVLREAINPEHYHDLGKWIFALTCFYAYMAFSQYLLIWYANLPEETIFFRDRVQGNWFWLGISMPFIRFLIPFFVLLCRPAKRSLLVIGLVAGWSVLIEYVDLYWCIMPMYYPNGPQIHWLDFATLGTTVSLCGLMFWSRFRKYKMIPVGDLRLEQSLHFENA